MEGKSAQIAKIKQELQAALILEQAPTRDEQGDFDAFVLSWLEKNGEKFNEAFEQMYEGNVNLITDPHADREFILGEIKKRL